MLNTQAISPPTAAMETALGEYKSLQPFFLQIATLTIFSIDPSKSIKDRLKPHPCLEGLVLITSLKNHLETGVAC